MTPAEIVHWILAVNYYRLTGPWPEPDPFDVKSWFGELTAEEVERAAQP